MPAKCAMVYNSGLTIWSKHLAMSAELPLKAVPCVCQTSIWILDNHQASSAPRSGIPANMASVAHVPIHAFMDPNL